MTGFVGRRRLNKICMASTHVYCGKLGRLHANELRCWRWIHNLQPLDIYTDLSPHGILKAFNYSRLIFLFIIQRNWVALTARRMLKGFLD